jgi:hypothetical protein
LWKTCPTRTEKKDEGTNNLAWISSDRQNLRCDLNLQLAKPGFQVDKRHPHVGGGVYLRVQGFDGADLPAAFTHMGSRASCSPQAHVSALALP